VELCEPGGEVGEEQAVAFVLAGWGGVGFVIDELGFVAEFI